MTSRTRESAAGPEVVLRAVEELHALAPDLGWAEASGLADALVDGLAQRCVDVAAGRAEPSTLPHVVGAIGGPDRPLDHASCRAAAARLRALAPALSEGPDPTAWAVETGAVMVDLADLLERLAHLARTRSLGAADKGVTLRRLHALQRRLR